MTMGMGIIATMAALVLGLLVASAQGSYEAQRNELLDASAKVMSLDHILAHYGPDTQEARHQLRNVVADAIDRMWPKEHTQSSPAAPRTASAELTYSEILKLSPKDDTQRTLKSEALSIALELSNTRWLLYEQGSSSISKPLLVVVVFWLTIIFVSFGLFAPTNSTVVSTLLVCALSVSGAIFLILELYRPFQGLIQLSSAPLRTALEHLGQ